MAGRGWLRHPPATVARPVVCPSGLPRFASLDFARASLLHGFTGVGLVASGCELCGGAHVRPTVKAPPGDQGASQAASGGVEAPRVLPDAPGGP
jgi:hypothetical protein